MEGTCLAFERNTMSEVTMQNVTETSLAMKSNTIVVCNTLYRKASSNLREFH